MKEDDRLAVADECLLNGGAVSSAVEHVVDIDGVTGSIPVPPTTPEIDIAVIDILDRHRIKATSVGRTVYAGYIYVIEAIGLRRFKIGITEDLGNRFPRYATECPVECRPVLVATVPIVALRIIEKKVHSHYAVKRVRGEWFDLDDQDLADIPDLLKKFSRQPLADLTRELNKFTPTWIERERQWKRQIEDKIRANPAPTEDLVLDALDYAAERNEPAVSYRALKRQMRERDDFYPVVLSLLRRGLAAIVEPTRCNETAVFSIEDIESKQLCKPRWGCDWDVSVEGVEVLVCETSESIHRVLSLVGSDRTIDTLDSRRPWRSVITQAAFQLKRHGRPDA